MWGWFPSWLSGEGAVFTKPRGPLDCVPEWLIGMVPGTAALKLSVVFCLY